MSKEELSPEERIANVLENFQSGIMLIIWVVLIAGIIILGFFAVMIFGGMIYDFFVYDLFGFEREYIGTVSANVASYPEDDCNYSKDEQLCYQTERVAKALELQAIKGSEFELAYNTITIDAVTNPFDSMPFISRSDYNSCVKTIGQKSCYNILETYDMIVLEDNDELLLEQTKIMENP